MLLLGVPQPMFALLQTSGRKTGLSRHTPVINGFVGDEFWIVAEHGRNAGYVRNLEADPRVRVRTGRRWRQGTAHVLDDDDPLARARWMRQELGRLHAADEKVAKMLGTTPLTVRIDLDEAGTFGERGPVWWHRPTSGTV